MSHPDIICPPTGKIFSVNHGNFFKYDEGVRRYINACQMKDKASGGPYTQRYIGSMVSDVHRNLIKGGIFMYPTTADNRNGKLRLQYECNPFAFIIEVAGGAATKPKCTEFPRDFCSNSCLWLVERRSSCVERHRRDLDLWHGPHFESGARRCFRADDCIGHLHY